MTDNELLLIDRIGTIKEFIQKHGEDKFYISFSGGKDSTVVSWLVDQAIPGNRIPRVFIDTGIEYQMIREFVAAKAKRDDRFIMIRPNRPITQMLEDKGYPFKSKEHSTKLHEFQKGNKPKSIIRYIEGNGRFSCPSALKCQFQEGYNLKVSQFCCTELKKKPIKRFEKETNRTIGITGMMAAEGGQRINLKCILADKDGNPKRFHPLAKANPEWETWLINQKGIEICGIYREPYNFKRTGCKGCPFSLNLQEQLETMDAYMPNERKQCEIIWKKVYDEYRKLGYRLKKSEQIKLL